MRSAAPAARGRAQLQLPRRVAAPAAGCAGRPPAAGGAARAAAGGAAAAAPRASAAAVLAACGGAAAPCAPRAARRLRLAAPPRRGGAARSAAPEVGEGEGGDASGSSSSKSDLFKASAILVALLTLGGALQHDWVAQHQTLALAIVFSLGYCAIVAEEAFALNKSGVALLTAVATWTVRAAGAPGPAELNASLADSLADVSQVVFFLIGAMTIVDAHAGFRLITDAIGRRDRRTLIWLVGGITFCMSAVLDNLTSTIVMVSMLRKLEKVPAQRKYLGAVVVVAANAGGAWTPIGDVTTTMLWINGQISAWPTMRDIFLPSLVSLLLPLALLSSNTAMMDEPQPVQSPGTQLVSGQEEVEAMAPRATLVLAAGVAALVFVPVFKSLTGLPPYLGMLFGLGALWLLTDAIHYGEPDRERLKVPDALSRIDVQGVLFFLGILLSISSLDSAGVLKQLATQLDRLGGVEATAVAIGLVSAVIDNVPLVAATMGMYDLSAYPADDRLWQLIAFCAGTGGSILVIGSASGVAFMGLEAVSFGWWLSNATGPVLAGYAGGVGAYLALHHAT